MKASQWISHKQECNNYINWKCQILLILPVIDVFDYLAFVDTRSLSFTACYVVWAALLSAVALKTYFTHFKLFYLTNVKGLVKRIIRFVMRTEPKASYWTVQYEYVYCYTPNDHSYSWTTLLN